MAPAREARAFCGPAPAGGGPAAGLTDGEWPRREAGPARRLIGSTRSDLAATLAEIGVPEREIRMRGAQLWHWVYHRGIRSFDEMTNVGKALRTRLAETCTLERPEIVTEQISRDGTRKWVLRMPSVPKDRGGRPAEIECVYIPESDRGTLCVSSQVGCTLTCSFCHTGTQRLVRNSVAGRNPRPRSSMARERLGDFPGRRAPTTAASSPASRGSGGSGRQPRRSPTSC